MKISLFLVEKILDFRLPNEVSGSFSFDDKMSDSKLINIDAREGKWFLYSTSDVKVIENNIIVDDILLVPNNFYVVKRDNVSYLLYVSSDDSIMKTYSYSKDTKFIIGNTKSCNIVYDCPFFNNYMIGVGYSENNLVLQKNENFSGNIYVNKKSISDYPYIIKNGDEVNIYGLRLLFINKMVFINSVSNLTIYSDSAKIMPFQFNYLEPIDMEIKDVDLYSKDDYASKAPRIRRVIETKKIELSQPPRDGANNEMPLILVIGPMFTMGLVSIVTLVNSFMRFSSGQGSILQIVMGFAMLLSSLVWPLVINLFNKRLQKKRMKKIIDKYTKYLGEKSKELSDEAKLQKVILLENLITVDECLNNIKSKNINFWSKRIDQNDFLVARIGVGNELLNAEIQYPKEGFTIDESELKKQADKLVEDSKYIENVPIGYSFYENVITAIMGNKNRTINFINNIIIQLLSFYSYEDLKIVTFTDENSPFDYLRYLNHSFSNDKSFRFFCSDYESSKSVAEYLNIEFNNRIESGNEGGINNKPHYLILVDDYDKVKRYDFFEALTESDGNNGFSLIICENRLSKLPSKCNNFIMLDENQSGVLKNSYEKQEQVIFHDEIKYGINMMEVVRCVSNVPIEFEESLNSLPNTISFLEMEDVGKVEQLNILNRWSMNDSTSSLRCEIGVDEQGDLMYLDLHEKFHGPHGLIAGTTGSGKSEFIITYILSMCINYSPDDVSFILIDYKGGGLALAFENRATGISLPHLAGTITNLDKAEMDRTLVSIDSEVKRRQALFNQARNQLGESTMDIYKYQSFYHDGKLKEPVSHLFIICDEFAELKSQQPDFMDNLISVARIGRSLGVHLILATQKPSGVVNDQIWSNTRFRVCLKVQDESDSREMLKKTDAAYLKQVGRFYLQVGYDEYYALGQSAWCGAKYYPYDKIVKQVDKSVNFIDDSGFIIKSVQASSGISIPPKGEQLSNVIKSIIDASNSCSKKSRKLWLDNIPEIILVNDLERKYNYKTKPFEVEAIIGEYDAPEAQKQDIVVYNFLSGGNTIIYGNDGSEREMMVDEIIYSSTKDHNVSELNYYIVDYGSESFRKYSKLPHVGGIVFIGDDEKYNNLFKMLKNEILNRKKLFADYGGEYLNYISNSGKTLPLKVVILNNYDSIYENNSSIYDDLPDLIRDSERYGIVFIITCNAINSVHNRISQNCRNIYTFRLKSDSDYPTLFGTRVNVVLRDMVGRGLFKTDAIHQFQVASIVDDKDKINDFINGFVRKQCEVNNLKAEIIPTLPSIVRIDNVISKISDLRNIPVGISKGSLEVATIDILSNVGYIVCSNKIENLINFSKSLISILTGFNNMDLIIFDAVNGLGLSDVSNYYTNNFETVLDNLIIYLEKLISDKSVSSGVILIYGISKFVSSIKDGNKITKFTQLLKDYERIGVIIFDDFNRMRKFTFESWFTNVFSVNNGIWIGRGVTDQNLIHLSTVSKEMSSNIKNDMGYVINEGYGELVKFIDFINDEVEDDYGE